MPNEPRLTLTAAQLHAVAEEAANTAAERAKKDAQKTIAVETIKEVLRQLGLADAEAGYDVRELREFIQLFRTIKRRVTLAVVVIVIAVFSPFAIGWLRAHL
jgi:hypothetical protein